MIYQRSAQSSAKHGLDRFSGTWKHEVLGIWGCADRIRQIGDKHVRKAIEHFEIVSTTGNLNRRAVHIHLPIANTVEPCPGESVLTIWQASGDSKVEWRKRAAADDAVDNFPLAVRGGFFIQGY